MKSQLYWLDVIVKKKITLSSGFLRELDYHEDIFFTRWTHENRSLSQSISYCKFHFLKSSFTLNFIRNCLPKIYFYKFFYFFRIFAILFFNYFTIFLFYKFLLKNVCQSYFFLTQHLLIIYASLSLRKNSMSYICMVRIIYFEIILDKTRGVNL